MRTRSTAILMAVVALVVMLVAVGLIGCTPAEEEVTLEPSIAPPAIMTAGTFKVGVDLDYPPFAGTEGERQAGLDIDVASAIAGQLGLELETVDVKPSEAATALADGTVDAVMSVPFTEEALVQTSLAGTYVTSGPAFFISQEGTGSIDASLTVDALGSQRVGAQEGSVSYWILEYEFGPDDVASYPTLREAMDALVAGDIDVLAGDAMVASYIATDGYETIKFAGQLEPATPYAVAVGLEAAELEEAVRGALDKLAADGVLSTIRAKWVGDLPELELESPE